MAGFGLVSGRGRLLDDPASLRQPLIVAIHGGTYDSSYFDVPGFSLLDRSAANGLPIVAIDRPGYGETPLLPRAETTLSGQARFLSGALAEIWRRHGSGRPGIVIVAHSIGAAIALIMTSRGVEFPLLGIAVSGVGMRTPAEHRPMWEALPDLDRVDVDNAIKDQVMFGPEGSFAAWVPATTHDANRPAPKVELVDIVSSWNDMAAPVLSGIAVPVHYRQGEFDRLWINGGGEVDAFADALSSARSCDARMEGGMGHCLDFHRIGPAFQLEQLAFALRCAAQSK